MKTSPAHTAAALNRRQFVGAAGAIAAAGLTPPTWAQVAERTGRIVTGFPAGAGSDPIIRLVAEKMRSRYFANLIVDNRTGAGGRIAAEAVRAAAPDGTTVLFTPASPLTIFPSIYKKLTYDPQKDFVPVGTLYRTQMGFIVSASCPANNLAEYIALAKKEPKYLSYGTPGAGTMLHFLGAMFKRESQLDLQHVPYRGAAPLWQDLLGGQIPAAFSPIGRDSVERHKTGKAKVIAVASTTRLKNLPDTPTFNEMGFKSVHAEEWFGLFLPAGATPETVASLRTALDHALSDPEVVAFLERNQSDPYRTAPADLAARIRNETLVWRDIVKSTDFTPED